MRTFSCVFAVGVLIAAICSGAADEKDAKKGASQAAANQGGVKATVNSPQSAKSDDGGNRATESDEQSEKYADEVEAILKTGVSFVEAYAKHDAKEVAAQFAPDAEYIDENGELFRGRAQIESTLKQFFKEHPKSQLSVDVESLRLLSPLLAVEDGTTTCVPDEGGASDSSRYTAIHTKSDGQWLVASVREHGMHGKRLHSVHLRQLKWLVGNWIDESDDSVVRFNCHMTEDGNFLVRDFDVLIGPHKVISGTQRSGWDPISGKLRAWTFDSDGGYFDGTWHRAGEKWVLTSTGVTADGQLATGTAIFTLVDDQTITWQAVNREVDGSRIEDSEEFTLVRTGPQPQTSDETEAR